MVSIIPPIGRASRMLNPIRGCLMTRTHSTLRRLGVFLLLTVTSKSIANDVKPIILPHPQEVELALAAAPEHLRAQATVYVYGKSGYQEARRGNNGFTCLVNRDGQQSGGDILRPTCWDAEGSATIVPVVLRVGELLAQGASAKDIEEVIEERFKEQQFISPRKTGIAYMLRGDVAFDRKTQRLSDTVFPAHYMIYAPGVSNADIGVTDAAIEENPALPFVYAGYSGGERTAYIIVLASPPAVHSH